MRYVNRNLAPQECKFAFRPRGQLFVWSAPHAARNRAHVLHSGSLLQVAKFGDSCVCRSSLRCALEMLEMFMGMHFPVEFLAPYVSYTTATTNITLRFYISLIVHLRIILAGNQFDAQFFLYNMFIWILYMFRATLCSSSGGQLY
jgi:hypothetical protein